MFYLQILGFLISTILLGGHAQAQALKSVRQSCQAVSAATCEVAHSLGRGVNMGAMLESPREGDWGLRLDPAYIEMVHGRFATIRLPVRWSNHAATTADATLDEFFASRVTKGIDAMLDKGFNVILNMHHYNQLFGDKLMPNEFAVDPQVLETRYINMWRQIALRYKNKSPKLIFELLNEPHDRISGATWNQLAAKALAVVRESNPDRVVIIGPGNYNNITELHKLRIPTDKNIIVAIHSYEPFAFTHQGANWLPFKLPTGITCCNIQQRKTITELFDLASTWNSINGYPIHLGEFGSLVDIDVESRGTYSRLVRDAAETKGIGWTYWEFGGNFGVYSPDKRAWIEPVRKALLD